MKKQDFAEIKFKALDFALLKRLLAFLKPYKKWINLAILLTIVTSALGPLRPYLTKIAVDDYIATSNKEGLISIILIIFSLLLIHGLTRFGLTYLMQWVGQNVIYDLRIKLFEHIQSLSISFFDKNPVGRLVTRVTNDVESLNELFSSGVVMIIADIMLILWIVVFMFFTNAELALLTLSVIPFLAIAALIFRLKVRELFRNIRLKLAEMNSFLSEYISGIETVKLFTQEKSKNSEFDIMNNGYKNLMLKTIFWHAIFFPIVEMLSIIALAIVLWFSAENIISGMMTVGTLIAFAQYAEMFFRPIRDLTEKYSTLQSSMASSERIFGLLDTEEKKDAIDNSLKKYTGIKDKIVFDNVSFSYSPGKPVLKNVSFTINKGDTIAVVGATGSGKTTIINLLCRFYEFDTGSITIDGIDIRSIDAQSLRNGLALVMQDVFLFSRDVASNITLGRDNINEEDMKNAAKALSAYDFINNLQGKFNTKLAERGATLSAGQRQLLAFCRAYAGKPDLLILDEATSNIDSQTEKIIENALDKLLRGRTSLIIAHRLSTIKRADKIIVLHFGEIREQGTHQELIDKNGLYARLYKLQLNKNEEIIIKEQD